MEIGIKVGDIMTREMVSVKPNISLINCVKKMVGKRVGSLLIKENNELKGILTERDILWVLTKKKDLSKIKVKDVMVKNPVIIKPEKDIYEALVLMKKRKIRWLPVVVNDKEKGKKIKKLIGLLTIKDILKIQPTLFDLAVQNYQIREEKEKKKRIELLKKAGEKFIRKGYCEECGNFDLLYESKGKLVCINCKYKLEGK